MAGASLSDRILAERDIFLSGKVTSIPFRFSRLSTKVPGIMRGMLECVTAASGVGKTKLVKKTHVFDAIHFAYEHKLDLKVIYFALEESFEEFEWSMYSYIVNGLSKGTIRHDIMDFKHMYTPPKDQSREGFAISQQRIDQIRDLRADQLMNIWRQYLIVYDYIYDTDGIKTKILDFSLSRGDFFYEGERVGPDEVREGYPVSKYMPYSRDEFIIVITDHVSDLMPTQEEKTKFEAILNYTATAKRLYTKLLNYNCTSVHMQGASTESIEHVKASMIMPTMDGLADCKVVRTLYQRMIGLGDPYRYKKDTWEDYNLKDFRDYSRFIVFAKQRFGKMGNVLPILFDGKTGYMETLPEPDNQAGLLDVIAKIDEWDRMENERFN